MSKRVVKGFLAKKYDKLLDSIQNAEESLSGSIPPTINESRMVNNNIGDDNTDEASVSIPQTPNVSNVDLIQHIAGSLLHTSIERLKQENSKHLNDTDNKRKQSSGSNTVKDNIMPDKAPADSQKEPFIDIFLAKLISRLIPGDLPEREHFGTESINQNGGKRYEPISASILASNLKKMSGSMENIFEMQDSIIRLITWRNPSGTIIMSFLITVICYNPMYLILLPNLFLMYGIIIPKYLEKHPSRRNVYHARRTYGKSLLKNICTGMVSKSSTISHSSHVEIQNENGEVEGSEEVNNGIQTIVNLRDLQDMTTGTINFFGSVSRFVNVTAGSKDELTTTKLFVSCFLFYVFLKLLSPFINWSFLISFVVWTTLISVHPKIRPLRNALFNINKNDNIESDNQSNASFKEPKIIIDNLPQVKYVEIFEIYRQGLLPGSWKLFLYSSNVFDPKDEYRRAQKPPPGAKSLELVLPPQSWIFDENSTWEVDYHVDQWSLDRGLSLSIENEYLCDSMFKRRRLLRRILK